MLDLDKDKLIASPKDGVYIHGLYCDGGRWDSHYDTLNNSELGSLYYIMPLIHFLPIENYVSPDDLYQY